MAREAQSCFVATSGAPRLRAPLGAGCERRVVTRGAAVVRMMELESQQEQKQQQQQQRAAAQYAVSRRAVVARGAACAAVAALAALRGDLLRSSAPHALAASVTDKTKGNQLLKSYGLPEQNVPSGFGLIVTRIKPDVVVSFVHPGSWLLNEEMDLTVDRPRLDKSRPKGKAIVRAAEFRKAEEVGIFLDSAGSASSIEQVPNAALLEILTGGEGATDAKLLTRVSLEPNRQLLTAKFVTVTDAAYAFDRRAIAVGTVVDGRLFLCVGQATDKRYKKSVGELLETSVKSFQIAKGAVN
mmetsp:Transcript_10966/g.29435  ORF Transcript_10966/g.29435 Transcript_10966/m.29435 type:complete len:298 (+) Transcript_10966:44-937(+)|eukprot:CAMPEP_0185832658 /NCGR_PEP_ID=MMETSP1353-20130828/2210_1 /TAXON_ID=1077150 /ORGANISM="Erythrolobus australicus, Strain CCMP3124" /LENGTH=297 /DNA_ID=CAMNT_0028530855 /DNA_START=46 /DNA_END=939 /DNA_ORIENTATION=+